MAYEDIESFEEAKQKILKVKTPFYTKDDVEFVFDKLDKGYNHHQISELSPIFSTRQIKLIRFIYQKGTGQDTKLLLTCDFNIANVKKYVQAKQKANKSKNPQFVLDSIMERGKKKGSLTEKHRNKRVFK